MGGPVGESDLRQQRLGAPPAFRAPDAGKGERQRDVLPGGHRRDQVEALEHHADMAQAVTGQSGRRKRREAVAFEPDFPGRGTVKAAEQVQQRGFPGTAGSEDRHEFAGLNMQGNAGQRAHDAAAHPVFLDDFSGVENGHQELLGAEGLSAAEGGLPAGDAPKRRDRSTNRTKTAGPNENSITAMPRDRPAKVIPSAQQ